MNPYRTTHLLFFSPTHSSAKIARAIAAGTHSGKLIETDLTYDTSHSTIDIKEDLVILAAPVYRGRVAPVAAERFKRILGNDTPAILAVVYGNRAYEDALIELRDMATHIGLVPLAAGTFIGEHSYSTPHMPIAAGRPDAQDLDKARFLGETAMEKQNTGDGIDTLKVNGNYPYKSVPDINASSPECTDRCISCGMCIQVCPTQAISFDHDEKIIVTDKESCICCCACVKGCPVAGRVYATPFAKYLYENFSTRREPELFL